MVLNSLLAVISKKNRRKKKHPKVPKESVRRNNDPSNTLDKAIVMPVAKCEMGIENQIIQARFCGAVDTQRWPLRSAYPDTRRRSLKHALPT